MAQLTEWLKLMLAEIQRKNEDADRAKAEEAARGPAEPAPRQKEPPQRTTQVRS
jgi:hypothetical protein